MNENLVGLIPSAGHGERLRYPIAKELWPIQKVSINGFYPLIENVMYNMYSAECDHQIFVTRHDKPEIMAHVSNVLPYHIHKSYVCQRYKTDVGKSSGLVDAIDSAYHLIKDRTVLFGMPDTFVEPSDCFEQLLTKYFGHIHAPDIVLGVFQTDTPEKFGMVYWEDDKKAEFFAEQKNQNKTVKEIFDKPKQSDLEYMWGIIVWNARFTEYLHEQYHKHVFDFAYILNSAIQEKFLVKAHVVEQGKYHDFGEQSDIIRFNSRKG